jgi:hypothetical protein
VDADAVKSFLARLRQAGIEPAQIVTDDSTLYPPVLSEIWPTAAHQLCLLHATRRVVEAVNDVVKHVRRTLAMPPPAKGLEPWSAVGANQDTVRRWLQLTSPDPATLAELGEALRLAPPLEPPPQPWRDWDKVRQVREDLRLNGSRFLRRPDHLSPEVQQTLTKLLASPTGAMLRVARGFLEAWFAIWRPQRRPAVAPVQSSAMLLEQVLCTCMVGNSSGGASRARQHAHYGWHNCIGRPQAGLLPEVTAIADDDGPSLCPRRVDLPQLERSALQPDGNQRSVVVDYNRQTEAIDGIGLRQIEVAQDGVAVQ